MYMWCLTNQRTELQKQPQEVSTITENLLQTQLRRAGDSYPLENVHEAIKESEKTGRKGKVFLKG